ncbi:MAG: hypothetical protein QF365_02770 [Candidatus Thalassarchaeaceae archaeon]|nr:hypothetical protein [Candidatus Thalassarchaeaceae archaeon]HJN70878.1 hypothetical protein [Candidatus Thalassarchaeaceae archaeon]
MCKQNYPNSQFVNGIGPLSLVCVRCATENDMLAEGETTTLYSDELVKARSTLFARRYRPWAFLGAGWILYLTFGAGIELWSNIFLVTLVLGTLATPALHFLTSTKFKAELAKLTP